MAKVTLTSALILMLLLSVRSVEAAPQQARPTRGELRLSRQLPANTSSCTITKDKDAEGNVAKVVAVCSLGP